MAILVARTNLPVWDFQKLASLLFIRALHHDRTVIIKICVDMSRRMWLVPVSSSLDNRDKTILKKF